MAALTALTISGSPSIRSRSRALLDHAAGALERAGARVKRVDLATLPASALLARDRHADVDAALAAVTAARIIVASTPVYRAAYSGLLKLFFDQLPPDALVGRVALGIATGASAEHALVLAHALAPLFESVGAVVVPGVYATDAQFPSGVPDAALLARVEHAASQALAVAGAAPEMLHGVSR